MIRRSLILWVVLIAAVSVALFVIKYEVKSLEEEYARLNREILRNGEAIHVLRAEWSYLNRPDQLAEMAQRHLNLQPLLAPQIGDVAALPTRRAEPGLADVGERNANEQSKKPATAKARTAPAKPVLTSAEKTP